MIKLSEVKSLSDLPEGIRGLFSECEDGAISLDEARVRTAEDVANLKRDKDKERDLGNRYKAELAKYRELAESPEELAEKIAGLEARSGNATEQTEKIAALQKELRQVRSEYGTAKTELDAIKPEFEKFKADAKQRKTDDLLSAFVKTLKGVDVDRLQRALKKDTKLGLIVMDESGEGLACADGSKLEEYAMNTAKDFGFIIDSKPGTSSPGTPKQTPRDQRNAPVNAPLPLDDGGMIEDDLAKQLG